MKKKEKKERNFWITLIILENNLKMYFFLFYPINYILDVICFDDWLRMKNMQKK